jgi:hypothetical protein
VAVKRGERGIGQREHPLPIAHGFTAAQIVELMRAGLASAMTKRMIVGGKSIEVARVCITEKGHQATSPS